jgi:hypothetical protein
MTKSTDVQIHVYSHKKAELIASELKEFNARIEGWMGAGGEWPPEPEVYIFLDVPEDEIVRDDGLAVHKIMTAIKNQDANAVFFAEGYPFHKTKYPSTVAEHCQWCELSVNEYQEAFPFWQLHPHAEKLRCKTCKLEWFSLPVGFEKARQSCICCVVETSVEVVSTSQTKEEKN